MVKEYEGKGRGLVAARDIKMGELILTDKAVLANEDYVQDGYYLTAEAERLLINQKILKDISLLNHSCAPNAQMGLLDGEKNKEPEKRFELRAVKNISKDDEVTLYYPFRFPFLPHAFNRASIQADFGFECRCVVCLGQVPNQEDILDKIREAMNHDVFRIKDEDKSLQDWKRQAIVSEIIFDLAKPLYMGRETDKMMFLVNLYQAAINSGNSVLERKALDETKELADKTGLEMMKNQVENLKNME